ncbi:hypothetical protein [Flavobacterium inviolabile]|uniref:hypothetical protein n=1 Tax=Flavobacterium inviolabile TaxID=2748320 RepID=UPI0015B13DC1|nr:hypothetical protein [Flavobacterium inviolabile]
MKAIITISIISIFFIGCKNQTDNKTTTKTFNLFGANNELLVKNYQSFQKTSLKNYDSINVFNGNKLVFSFNEKQNSLGIFKSCNSKFIQSHSFDTISLANSSCIKPFLISRKTKLINQKEYVFKGEKYHLFHYSEEINSHKSFDSYYIKGIGFICYYNFDTDRYIFANDISKDLKNDLISDSTFFARYTVSKLFPKYYRVSHKEGTFW